ncbi:MAG: helix-turn-helix transcriptional regulator [Candidatus Cloacimonetes bacterium]|nr:helix-turn-helix transcriptional regulator [Candidatus Cloacimonadota bacterium]
MGNTNLKNEIKVFWAKFNISQRELAEGIGVTRKTINTIETGRFVPSTILSMKIAKFFKTTVEEIFTLEEEIK